MLCIVIMWKSLLLGILVFCFIILNVLFLWQVLDFGFVREVNFNLEGGKFFIKWIVFEAIKKGVGFVIDNREIFFEMEKLS